MFDYATFHAIAGAPPGLIRRAIAQAGITFSQFITWLGTGNHALELLQIGVEFALGNQTQAVQDLVALLTQPTPPPPASK